jgi:peptide chain release factor subunit 1
MADINSKERFNLKKLVNQLSKYRGRHTELVTRYIPAGYDMNKVINQLQEEQGTASNIKSTSTRKNVTDALERMIQHLKLFKQTPANGLAIFSGNISEKEGGSDVQVFSIEPPVPLKIGLYRCDKAFVIDPLMDMLDIKEVYGLVVFDNRDADFALLKGKTIIHLRNTHSEVPGKMKAGGQSSARFARNRELAVKDHYKKIADYMKELFLNLPGLKGIILGGPGVTVNHFLGHDYVTGDVKKKIIATKDLGYTGEFGLEELVDKSQDVLAAEDIASEKAIMQKFFNLLATKSSMVAYGPLQVENALNMGAVMTLLLSEDLETDVIEKFEKQAALVGTEVMIISVDTREGVQLREMGKIAAILRYAVE